MPTIAKRACRCGGTVTGTTCDKCGPRRTWRFAGRRDSRWDTLSLRLRTEQPLCMRCQQQGTVTPATEVHHRIPVEVRPDLLLDRNNCECVCRACHEVAERESSAIHRVGGVENVAASVVPGRSQGGNEFRQLSMF